MMHEKKLSVGSATLTDDDKGAVIADARKAFDGASDAVRSALGLECTCIQRGICNTQSECHP